MTATNMVSTLATRGERATHNDSDGSRLWESIRALSVSERDEIERALSQFRSEGGPNAAVATNQVVLPVKTNDGTSARQVWACDEFVETLLNHMRELVHEQSHVETVASDPATSATINDEGNHVSAAFSLQTEDFPSLGGTPLVRAAFSLKQEPSVATTPVKAVKRRITTTLIATDAPYAAVAVKQPTVDSVDNASAQQNAWSKVDLMERRMAPSAHHPQSREPSPLKAPVPTRRVALVSQPPLKVATSFQQATILTPQAKPPSAVFNAWMSPPPSMERTPRKPPSLTLCGKQKRAKRASLMTANETDKMIIFGHDNQPSALPLEPATANIQAARLYGHLITQRLVPSICSELQFLIGLLYRPSCANANTYDANSDHRCASTNEFCRHDASSAFAATAIETIEPTLLRLGTDMVHLVAKSLEGVRLCEDLVSRLRQAMQEREERRVEESAKLGCELPIETKVASFRDYALPFCQDMDSRLNYRTPVESVIYSNREKIRDSFLSQVRAFQKRQNSLLGSDASAMAAASAADAQQLLKDVMPENQWWFARFFVLELVQLGSNPLGESDKDLVLKIMEDKMVVKNPDRLRKLHRRFSSQNAPDMNVGGGGGGAGGVAGGGGGGGGGRPTAASGGGAIHGGNRTKSNQLARHGNGSGNGGSNNSKAEQKHHGSAASGHHHRHHHHNNNNSTKISTAMAEPRATSTTSAGSSTTSAFDHMRKYFSDNQLFFFHFLVSCDSFQFAHLVQKQVHAQFRTVWQKKPSNSDPRKAFTETVLRLKVLAKFLGFLQFSPQWHWSTLSASLSSTNPALEAAHREAVATMEQSQCSGMAFDVVALLEESIVSRNVAKCIPWLCDYLTMASSDTLSTATSSFQRVLTLLRDVHRSKMVDKLGETGLYVAMQIERLFQVLAVEELLLPRGDDPRVKKEATKHTVKRALLGACSDGDGGREAENNTEQQHDQAIDSLPFLYSNMFVQVCISELDDLRGFIQTRARTPRLLNSHRHHAAGSQLINGDKATHSVTLRKVRPMQVLREEQLEIPTTATLAGSSASSSSSLTTASFLHGSGSAEQRAGDESPTATSTTSHPNTKTHQQRDAIDENPLREAFFKLYPQLKRAVEFVVDMVVTNMCEHAIAKYVQPTADSQIDDCVAQAKATAPAFTQLILHEFQVRVEETLERFMATTAATALQEAQALCADRVEAALVALVAPSTLMQLVSTATKIAQQQAKAAISSLITRSLKTEFLKRVAIRKRVIVKEATTAGASSTKTSLDSSGTVASAATLDQDSVTRALSFSFDGTTDGSGGHSPLDDAMESIKTSVIGMAGTLQLLSHGLSTMTAATDSGSVRTGEADSPPPKKTTMKRLTTSFVRFHRTFRDSLGDAIAELQELQAENDHVTKVAHMRRHRVVMWSWIWRGVRLWLKVFAMLLRAITTATSNEEVGDFIRELVKTLNVVVQLVHIDETTTTTTNQKQNEDEAAFMALCRLITTGTQTASSLPAVRALDDHHCKQPMHDPFPPQQPQISSATLAIETCVASLLNHIQADRVPVEEKARLS